MAEKILVVDDDLDTLRLVGIMLERQGYEILAASTGRQAISVAHASYPDLILLDLMMPDIDGLEVARELRAIPETQDIPIIMFTAKAQLDDKLEGFDAGADAYLTKPTQPRELLAQVKAVLSRSKKARTAIPARPVGERGKVIGVISAKGGAGVTTLTANLAFSLRTRAKKEVIAADFRPGAGMMGLELGYSDADGFSHLFALAPGEIRPAVIEPELVSYDSQVRFLLSSSNPRHHRYITALEHFSAIADNLAYLAPFSILDLGSGMSPLVVKSHSPMPADPLRY